MSKYTVLGHAPLHELKGILRQLELDKTKFMCHALTYYKRDNGAPLFFESVATNFTLNELVKFGAKRQFFTNASVKDAIENDNAVMPTSKFVRGGTKNCPIIGTQVRILCVKKYIKEFYGEVL
jgi:hypothetical protein